MKKQEAYHLVLYRGKPHGFKGHIKFHFFADVNDDFIDIEHLFIKKNGSYLPYFVEDISFANDKYCIVKLEGVDNNSEIIADVYIPAEQLDLYVNEDIASDEMIGYQCEDIHKGLLGTLIRIDQLPSQEMAIVQYQTIELPIPLVDDLIVDIDDAQKKIVFNLPEGYLEIYN